MRDLLGKVGWYLKQVSGEGDYERWVAHQRSEHPDRPVMARSDWERGRQDAKNARPRSYGPERRT